MDSQYKLTAKWTDAGVVAGMRQIEQQIKRNTAALREQQHIKIGTAQQLASVRNNALRERQEIINTGRAHREAQRQHQTGLSRTLEMNERLYRFGRETRYVWREQADSLRQYTDEAMRLSQAQQKFKAIGLSPEDNERAFRAAKQTVNEVKGLRLADATEVVSDLTVAFGDLGHAIEALPLAGKYRVAFQTLFGERFSPEQIESQIQQGFKFLEMIGSTNKGREEMERMFNVMTKMSSATAGRVNPSEMLQMARTGGTALQGLTAGGLLNMSAALQELGGRRAGTAMQSAFQNFVAARLSQRSLREFQRLDLLDKTKVEFTHAGLVKRALPGAIKIGDLMQKDMLQFADALAKAMAAKKIDIKDVNAVTKEVALLTGNRTAAELLSIFINQRSRVVKEANLAAGAKDIAALYDQALSSPAGKIEQFNAAIDNLRATVGGPLLESLGSLLNTFRPIIELMGEYPKITLAAIALMKLGVVSQAVGAALQSSGLARFFGMGRGAAAATTAVELAGTGAAVGMGSRFAMVLRSPALLGHIGAAVAVWSAVIRNELANRENEREAAEAGGRIGQMLKLRFEQQIKGNLSAEVQSELDKVAAPKLATNIIQEQGLGVGGGMLEFWKSGFKSRFVEGLEYITQLRGFEQRGALNPSLRPRLKETEERLKGSLYSSGIMSAPQLGEYLKQAQESLRAAGRIDLYPALERLAKDAFPQLASELEKVSAAAPAVDDFTRAIRRATGTISVIPAPFGGFFGRTFPTPKGGLPGVRSSEFNLHDGIRPFAKGGIVSRPTLALLGEGGEPEFVSPMSKLMRAISVRGGNTSLGGIHVHVHGNAESGIEHKIAEAVEGKLRDLGLLRLSREEFRDHLLSI